MHGRRTDRARARARLLLEAPISGDTDLPELQRQSARYCGEAKQWEAEIAARVAEPDELISATLGAVARDYSTWLCGTARRRTRIYDH
jgi:hypothetical protein